MSLETLDLTLPARQATTPRATKLPTPFSQPPATWTRSLAHAGSRPLFGGLNENGFTIDSHDLHAPTPLAWRFHPNTVQLCLNLAGHGLVRAPNQDLIFEPLTSGFCIIASNKPDAWRQPGEQHRFITIAFSDRFLRARLGSCDGGLGLLEAFTRDSDLATTGQTHRMTSDEERLAAQMMHPPVAQAARGLWYEAKVLELMAGFFFERPGEGELLCDRQKRLARERVDRVVAILKRRLSEPVNLAGLAREVGCSPFHLSRTFSQEMALTIPRYLRKLRMERAGELLRSGRHNVTEAALEVGYSSLSHFSQAFCETMGCCPGLYPRKTPPL